MPPHARSKNAHMYTDLCANHHRQHVCVASMTILSVMMVWASSCVPSQFQTLEDAPLVQEVTIAYSGRFWWADEFGPHWQPIGCTLHGQPLQCDYVSMHHAPGNDSALVLLSHAHAYVSNICWNTTVDVPAGMQHTLQVLHSMESEGNHPCMKRQPADIRMTYQHHADVWVPYWLFPSSSLGSTADEEIHLLRTPPKPFQHKLHAIFYVCNNPHSSSGRHGVVEQLQAKLKAINSSLAIHSYGKCNPNVDVAVNKDFQTATNQYEKYATKVAYMRKYKFCIVFENSLDRDYVTEKVYHAFIAGCLPIYWGAPNFADFIPDFDAVVDYSGLGSVDRLVSELERLTDEAAYTSKFIWKGKPVASWTLGFQKIIQYTRKSLWCHLCEYVAQYTSRRDT